MVAGMAQRAHVPLPLTPQKHHRAPLILAMFSHAGLLTGGVADAVAGSAILDLRPGRYLGA